MNLEIKDNSQTRFLRNQWEDGWLFVLFVLKFFVWVKYISLSPVSAWRKAESRIFYCEFFWDCIFSIGNALFRERICTSVAKISKMLDLQLHIFFQQGNVRNMSGILLA